MTAEFDSPYPLHDAHACGRFYRRTTWRPFGSLRANFGLRAERATAPDCKSGAITAMGFESLAIHQFRLDAPVAVRGTPGSETIRQGPPRRDSRAPFFFESVAQLAERWSPKPEVRGSRPCGFASFRETGRVAMQRFAKPWSGNWPTGSIPVSPAIYFGNVAEPGSLRSPRKRESERARRFKSCRFRQQHLEVLAESG